MNISEVRKASGYLANLCSYAKNDPDKSQYHLDQDTGSLSLLELKELSRKIVKGELPETPPEVKAFLDVITFNPIYHSITTIAKHDGSDLVSKKDLTALSAPGVDGDYVDRLRELTFQINQTVLSPISYSPTQDTVEEVSLLDFTKYDITAYRNIEINGQDYAFFLESDKSRNGNARNVLFISKKGSKSYTMLDLSPFKILNTGFGGLDVQVQGNNLVISILSNMDILKVESDKDSGGQPIPDSYRVFINGHWENFSKPVSSKWSFSQDINVPVTIKPSGKKVNVDLNNIKERIPFQMLTRLYIDKLVIPVEQMVSFSELDPAKVTHAVYSLPANDGQLLQLKQYFQQANRLKMEALALYEGTYYMVNSNETQGISTLFSFKDPNTSSDLTIVRHGDFNSLGDYVGVKRMRTKGIVIRNKYMYSLCQDIDNPTDIFILKIPLASVSDKNNRFQGTLKQPVDLTNYTDRDITLGDLIIDDDMIGILIQTPVDRSILYFKDASLLKMGEAPLPPQPTATPNLPTNSQPIKGPVVINEHTKISNNSGAVKVDDLIIFINDNQSNLLLYKGTDQISSLNITPPLRDPEAICIKEEDAKHVVVAVYEDKIDVIREITLLKTDQGLILDENTPQTEYKVPLNKKIESLVYDPINKQYFLLDRDQKNDQKVGNGNLYTFDAAKKGLTNKGQLLGSGKNESKPTDMYFYKGFYYILTEQNVYILDQNLKKVSSVPIGNADDAESMYVDEAGIHIFTDKGK